MTTMGTSILILILLASHACGTMDYGKIKLKPTPREYLDPFSKLRPGMPDKLTGCMCPASLNTTGSFYMFCGPDLNPREGGICLKEGMYRCIDGQKEAILTADCATSSGGGNVCQSLNSCPYPLKLKDCSGNNPKACVA